MPKALIIAEKPSVANDLQRVLSTKPGIGKFKKEKDFFENDNFVISSAIGHLVEQQLPVKEDGKSLPWKFDVLPIIPEEFVLQTTKGGKTRFNLLKRLVKRKDVDKIINACDAGREGELIFRYIMKMIGIEKPIERLWLRSMTNNAIKEGFEKLRDEGELKPLADAALCRSESDWLIGINSTRALTAYNSKYGGFNKTPVGRVQTPTLALMVKRENEIRDFIPQTYFEVHADFRVKNGEYPSLYFDEKFKKSKENEHGRSERIWDEKVATQVLRYCEGKEAEVSDTSKPQKQYAPQLYDLTALQRDSASRFGLSARRTLQIAQSLYERHKVLTYPRTDSRYLPEDYLDELKGIFANISEDTGVSLDDKLKKCAGRVLSEGMLKPSKKIFDDKKVSDHFAITPTNVIPKSLDEYEKRIYLAVLQRTIAIFYPPAEFLLTTRISKIDTYAFRTRGKVLVKPGWQEVYGKEAESKDSLPSLDGENTAKNIKIEIKKKETRPPARYNESTLLSAMESAGKFVKEEELKEAMKERGLGTPATRASIIEGLIFDKYVTRESKEFYVNNRGLRLIEQLQDMKIDILASPELTGEWEHKLKNIEQNKFSRPKFMDEIKDLTREVVKTSKKYADDALTREYPPFDAKCPQCGADGLSQDDGAVKCKQEDCNFKLLKTVASRPMSEEEIKELIKNRKLPVIDGLLTRFRKPFSAAIELVPDPKKKNSPLKVGFIFEKSPEELAEIDAVKSGEVLCECSVCEKDDIFITATSYLCGNRANNGTGECKARLSRVMCKYEIPPEQAKKFFIDGETDVIDKFISKKERPFSAILRLNKKGARLMQWIFPKKALKPKAKAENKKKDTEKV